MHRQKRNTGSALLGFAALFLLLFPVSVFAKGDRVPADQDEAAKWISNATKRMYKIDRLDDQYLLYSSWDGRFQFGIALARVSSVHPAGIRDGYYSVAWRDYTHDKDEDILLFTKGRAESFAAALDYLTSEARANIQARQDAALKNFAPQAKAWRESSSKPAMPEAAREHQVLAEYSFKERQTEKAIREYQAAVDIFPTWPEGQFNLATLAGEQKDYHTAILHMTEYLELTPDSADAQAAKDSIIIWKDKLSSIASVPESPTTPARKRGLWNVSHTSK